MVQAFLYSKDFAIINLELKITLQIAFWIFILLVLLDLHLSVIRGNSDKIIEFIKNGNCMRFVFETLLWICIIVIGILFYDSFKDHYKNGLLIWLWLGGGFLFIISIIFNLINLIVKKTKLKK